MPFRIDELTTEVITEAESPGAREGGAGAEPWRDALRIREALVRNQRDHQRTAAREFDD
jgi:hypothetical protein